MGKEIDMREYNLKLDEEKKDKLALEKYKKKYKELNKSEKEEIDSIFWLRNAY